MYTFEKEHVSFVLQLNNVYLLKAESVKKITVMMIAPIEYDYNIYFTQYLEILLLHCH